MDKKRIFSSLVLMSVLFIMIGSTASARDNYEGYIYGKVSTRTGNTYVGTIRWDDEEAFWDDLFNSVKEDLPYMEKYVDDDEEDYKYLIKEQKVLHKKEKELRKKESKLREKENEIRAKVRKMNKAGKYKDDYDDELESVEEAIDEFEIELDILIEEINEINDRLDRSERAHKSNSSDNLIDILGGSIKVNIGKRSVSRQFIARFGDISKIEVIGSEDAEVTMKNGSTYVVSGFSNDVGNQIKIMDESLGSIDVSWRKIDTIEFLPTPKNIKPIGYRISGTVMTDAGEFKGYIQWDSQECLSYDKIDGDSEDGRLSIDMGKIKKIERRNRSSSYIELNDGRKILLDGTNDVDGSIRGIMVEDERYGRVKVSWEAFEYASFEKTGKTGKSYDDYKKPKKLHGKVFDVNGKEYKGYIVFDYDESETWEMLNGERFDIEYNIPFNLLKSIEPRSRNASQIHLVNGEVLRLGGSQDVSGNNDGILILKDEKSEPIHVSWDDLEKIIFD